MIEVVGTMFFLDMKLLIDKPRSKKTYQMVGGKIECDETPLEAAIRESCEELATSDKNQKIHFYVFKYNGKLKGNLTTSEEIEKFLWYESKFGNKILSNTLKNEVVPYCLKKKLIK